MEKDSSEIEKLTERIAKDPKSKLFVPLAEEYKKAGDIEMAIHVLTEGLKNNPGYVTARSSLGRLLIERGDFDGAQKELEEVIKAIPDNLLAQRKLGELYVLQGRNGDALQRFKTCLSLNPGDKDLTSLVADLEGGKDVSPRIPKPKVPAQPVEASRPAAARTAQPLSGRPVQAVSYAAQVRVPSASPAMRTDSVQQPAAVPIPPAIPQIQETAVAVPPSVQTPEPAAPTVQQALEPHVEPEIVEEISELEPLDNSVPAAAPIDQASVGEEPVVPREAAAAETQPVLEIPAAGEFDLAEPGEDEPVLATEAWPAPAELHAVPAEPSASLPQAAEEQADDINTNTLAELYIAQGFYDKAIEIYQGMLSENPSNEALRQKLEKLDSMAEIAERNATFGMQDLPSKTFAPPAPEPVMTPEEIPLPEAERTKLPQEASAGLGEALLAAVEAPLSGTEASAGPAAEQRLDQEGPRPPAGAETRRKETIDRLESWLKNVIKEQP